MNKKYFFKVAVFILLISPFIFLTPAKISSADSGSADISLISPAGGEIFSSGQNITIKWNQANISVVNISYHNDDQVGDTIVSSLPVDMNAASGSFDWTVPKLPTRSDYSIRIQGVNPVISNKTIDSGKFTIMGAGNKTNIISNIRVSSASQKEIILEWDTNIAEQTNLFWESGNCSVYWNLVKSGNKLIDPTNRTKHKYYLGASSYDHICYQLQDSAGNSTEVQIFQKPTVADLQMTNLTFTPTTNNIKVNWVTNQPVISAIYIKPHGSSQFFYDSPLTAKDNSLKTAHELAVNNLQANTSYDIRVENISAGGQLASNIFGSNFGLPYEFRTLDSNTTSSSTSGAIPKNVAKPDLIITDVEYQVARTLSGSQKGIYFDVRFKNNSSVPINKNFYFCYGTSGNDSQASNCQQASYSNITVPPIAPFTEYIGTAILFYMISVDKDIDQRFTFYIDRDASGLNSNLVDESNENNNYYSIEVNSKISTSNSPGVVGFDKYFPTTSTTAKIIISEPTITELSTVSAVVNYKVTGMSGANPALYLGTSESALSRYESLQVTNQKGNSFETKSILLNLKPNTTYYYRVSLNESSPSRIDDVVRILKTKSEISDIKKPTTDNQINDINNQAKSLNDGKISELLKQIKLLRDELREQAAELKYLKTFATQMRALNANMQSAIKAFIAYGVDDNTKKLGEGERAAVVSSYEAAYDKLPQTESELADAIKIANGRFPSATSDKAEKQAKEQFLKIYKRVADMNDAKDAAAIKVMAYGLRQKATNRNLNSEKAGITTFKHIFGNNPKSTEDWNTMQAITYSGATKKIDTDKDALADETEAKLGTDPRNADSDGDGYKDGEEVLNGYSPKGAGKL